MSRWSYGFWAVWMAVAAPAAEAPIVPHTVCEILKNLPGFESGPVAAMGRYSFREEGIWLSEQACDTAAVSLPLLWLVEDSKGGPKPPADFEIDGVALNQKFAELQKHTSLGKFRFGSPAYDRWAVVYGKIEPRTGDQAKKALANLVFRGDGVVVFLRPETITQP